MKIYIASDHGGVQLKKKLTGYLKSNELDVQDIGIPNSEQDDYPEFALKLGEMVRGTTGSLGILICRSGVGMSIAANKVKGIRCVRALSVDDAFKGKNHNGCNVIALGSDITTDINLVYDIVDTFINTKMPSEARHLKRVEEITKYEENHGN